MDPFLLQAVVYLGAAIVCVPIAKKLGMGSVLGYLVAGILIGPYVLGFVGSEGKDIMHFAEFGVVMMLFLIGLELEPAQFWKMRKMIMGVGLSQMLGSTVILGGIALAMGFEWRWALAVGLALALSSTAIGLQSLKEKNLMPTPAGQNSFAVLLFQDISVIPILALLPLLMVQSITPAGGHESSFDHLPRWAQTLTVLSSVAGIVLAGKFVVVPLLRLVAKTRLRELFTASALFLVVAIAYLMHFVGLSPALGTFLAGVVLANSEFKHELESDLEPFKGLLLGLFFMGVGASINFLLIADQPLKIGLLTLGIVSVKTAILLGVGRYYKMKWDQNLVFAIGLSQVGEFAFVLFSFIHQLRIINSEWTDVMMAVTALSMTSTPLMLLFFERFVFPRLKVNEKEGREPDVIETRNKVMLVGFSHFGSTVGRFLRANGVEATILDNDPERVELLRKLGFKVYFGDATRMDLLESAGAEDAEILITAIDSPETNKVLVESVQKHFPHLELMVRARNRYDAYELMDLKVEHIYRETVETSLRLGVDVLRKLGHRAYAATRSAQQFKKYDEEALKKLSSHRHNSKQYISKARQQIEFQEELLTQDRLHNPTMHDYAWDSEELRAKIGKALPK